MVTRGLFACCVVVLALIGGGTAAAQPAPAEVLVLDVEPEADDGAAADEGAEAD
ncbi:MAG: hypothetical protein FJ098_00845, partial [Deltaproteobacteria bacterium]|nr:hypothetical protein [Deltaproteobacteria bacterium]